MAAPPDSTLTIVVDGRSFGGWLSVRVTAGIERAARDFDIACSQRWPGQDERFQIPEGASCEVFIGRDKVITGWVDKVTVRRGANDATCSIAGRSKTGDLVDCSPNYTETELAGLGLDEVARRVCAPFGIDVVVAGDVGPVYAVASKHHGETAFQVIERLARQRKMLVTDDEQGRLVLTQLAAVKADDMLIHPSDGLEEIDIERDMSKRFSVYTVKAQAGQRWLTVKRGDGTDPSIPSTLAHVEGAIFDNGVRRYRPKTIRNEGSAKKEGVMARAEWEARRAIGLSLRLKAKRVKWRQSSGALWRPNLLVDSRIPSSNVDATLALGEVTYRLDDQAGEMVELDLAPPDAFTPEPPDTEGGAGGTGHWGLTKNALGPDPE